MKKDNSKLAVMTLEEGEDFIAGQATAHIPQVGVYKLLAKKRVDGTIEWAHFVQRDNGLKEKVLRGTVHTLAEFDVVTETINQQLRRIFHVTMEPAAYEARTLDGMEVSGTIH